MLQSLCSTVTSVAPHRFLLNTKPNMDGSWEDMASGHTGVKNAKRPRTPLKMRNSGGASARSLVKNERFQSIADRVWLRSRLAARPLNLEVHQNLKGEPEPAGWAY